MRAVWQRGRLPERGGGTGRGCPEEVEWPEAGEVEEEEVDGSG